MVSTLSAMMWMVIMAALFCRTDADLMFCGSGNMMEREMAETILHSDGYQSQTYSPNLDKCLCSLRANGTIFLRSTVKFMTYADAAESNDTCGPLLKFENEKLKSYVCPSKGQTENDTVLTHHLQDEEVVSVEVINSAKTGIQAMVSFQVEVFQGTFSIQCETIRASTSRGICPCNLATMMGVGETGWLPGSDGNLGTKFAIAIVCVIIFLVIFGGLFLLWWKKLRNRDDDGYKDDADGMPPQQVPVAPEKGHVNPQFTDIGRHNPDGDPELNLALQTPSNSMGSKGLRGSTDSGLYSQGNGQHYANIPGDHGEGLPPDMLYTPGLNLSGHADLNGPGATRPNRPVDVDALYAKPAKERRRSGSRSASNEQLNVPPQGHHPQGPGNQPQGQAYRPQDQDYHPQGQGYHPQGQGYHPQGQGYHPGPNRYGPGQFPQRVNESFVSDSSHNASQASLNTSQTVETDV